MTPHFIPPPQEVSTSLTQKAPALSISDKIIRFPDGLFGFPTCREFVMAQKPSERPFVWMHSVSEQSVAFALVDAYAWDADLVLDVDDAELKEMGSLDPRDYAVYFILRIREEDGRTTLQARPNAPILVNIRNRQARQVIIPRTAALDKAEALCLRL